MIGFGMKSFCATVGESIRQVGFHAIPIPYVKQAIEFTGWCIRGKSPSKFVSMGEEHSQMISITGKGKGAFHHMVVNNGICNSLDEVINRAFRLSEKYGNINVHAIYNSTHGAVLDICEVLCQKVGIPTRMQEIANRETARIAASLGQGETLLAIAHSQGCETTYNLPSWIRAKMVVDAYGPARILQAKDFKQAMNYIAQHEFVHLLGDPKGYLQAKYNAGNVYSVPSIGNPLANHALEGGTYAAVVDARAEFFKKNNGLYNE